ncbi:hypothetical protein [Brevibacillus reuszeri]|uniref:hypothetical protein n=1 Tax=Brevibacillus reuszeri TaxID=54915 RepID=UPI00289AA7FE|nr:hypothetical protein [Brevibacillus reuszeri]
MLKKIVTTMVLVMALSTGVASAGKVGVSVIPGIVKVTDVVQPGTNKLLINLQVKNDGDDIQTFTLTSSGGLVINEKPFELSAGQTKEVAVWLNVKEDTTNGDYLGIVTAVGKGKDSPMSVETKFTCQYKVEKPKPWWEKLWGLVN